MTDYDALLTQIIAEPDADLPRLAFADMLEDYGRADRAELIRAQVGFADRSAGRLEVERRLLGSAGERVWQRRRGWALPAIVRPHWPREVGGWEWHRGFPEVWHCPLALWLAHGPAVAAATPIRRVISIDLEPVPLPQNPRKPHRTWFRDDARWAHPPADGCVLPAAVFDLLEPDPFDIAMFDYARTFPTRAAAMAAVSDACLRLAQHGTLIGTGS